MAASSQEAVNKMSDGELYQFLVSHNQEIGPITPTTRSLYEKKAVAIYSNNSPSSVQTSVKKGRRSEIIPPKRRPSISPSRTRKSLGVTTKLPPAVKSSSSTPPRPPSPTRPKSVTNYKPPINANFNSPSPLTMRFGQDNEHNGIMPISSTPKVPPPSTQTPSTTTFRQINNDEPQLPEWKQGLRQRLDGIRQKARETLESSFTNVQQRFTTNSRPSSLVTSSIHGRRTHFVPKTPFWKSEKFLFVLALFATIVFISVFAWFVLHYNAQENPKKVELKKFLCVEENEGENFDETFCMKKDELIQAAKDIEKLNEILVQLSHEYVRSYPQFSSSLMSVEIARDKLSMVKNTIISSQRWNNVLRILLRMGRPFYEIGLFSSNGERELKSDDEIMEIEYLKSFNENVSQYYFVRMYLLKGYFLMKRSLVHWLLLLWPWILLVGIICILFGSFYIAYEFYRRQQVEMQRKVNKILQFIQEELQEQLSNYQHYLSTQAYVTATKLKYDVDSNLQIHCNQRLWTKVCEQVYANPNVDVRHLRGVGEIWHWKGT